MKKTAPLIERAARALCVLDGNPADATMDGRPLWEDYLPEVRAVLITILEPDAEVLLAMHAPLGRHDDEWPISHDDRDSWRAGIGAILGARPE